VYRVLAVLEGESLVEAGLADPMAQRRRNKEGRKQGEQETMDEMKCRGEPSISTPLFLRS
jgi:hypothetical protein